MNGVGKNAPATIANRTGPGGGAASGAAVLAEPGHGVAGGGIDGIGRRAVQGDVEDATAAADDQG